MKNNFNILHRLMLLNFEFSLIVAMLLMIQSKSFGDDNNFKFVHEFLAIESSCSFNKVSSLEKGLFSCQVNINGSNVFFNDYSHFVLETPKRLVIDITVEGVEGKNLSLKKNKSFKAANNGNIFNGARLGKQENITRVVFDMSSDIQFEYETKFKDGKKNSILLYLRETPSISKTDLVGFKNTKDNIKNLAPKSIEPTAPILIITPTPVGGVIPAATATVIPTATIPFIKSKINLGSDKLDNTNQAQNFKSNQLGDAKFSIDRLLVIFYPDQKPTQNINLKNNALSPIFISSKVYSVNNPGRENEEIRETSDLLVSPKNIPLGVGEQRTVRIVSMKEKTKWELVYRIVFTPQVVDSNEKIELTLGKNKATLNVITALAVSIFVEPNKINPEIKTERVKDNVIFSNVGNVSVLLSEGRACKLSTLQNIERVDKDFYNSEQSIGGCREIPSKRLYPGDSWKVSAMADERLRFIKKVGENFEALFLSPEL